MDVVKRVPRVNVTILKEIVTGKWFRRDFEQKRKLWFDSIFYTISNIKSM